MALWGGGRGRPPGTLVVYIVWVPKVDSESQHMKYWLLVLLYALVGDENTTNPQNALQPYRIIRTDDLISQETCEFIFNVAN